ncbi:hypothetical protein NQ318_015251 [Aromia moschata]|uniref:Uncharacterized protein n=1 Tax=Aromia moschata TaxID=1265417 RepID=A0AAV8YI86_9CUCU|nr:hypothetical protein NQ318_015251 [Aromia moschata]
MSMKYGTGSCSSFLIKVVYTCGLCEVVVNEITDHPCIEGYGHIYIDNNHYFFSGMMEKPKFNVRRSQLNDHTEGVVEDELETNENICPNKRQ